MSLKVKYTNHAEYQSTVTASTATVDASATVGINIFRQGFPGDQTVKGDAGAAEIMIDDDIIAKLNTVLVGSKTPAIVKLTDTTNALKPLVELDTDDTPKGLVEQNDKTYRLKPGYGLVFQAFQGTGAQTDATRYVTYYCYFKEKASSSDAVGNLWVAYITGKDRAPLLFDVQDDRDIVFTVIEEENALAIKSVDTTNFLLSAITGGYSAEVELKNTAFNLSTDDTIEGKAIVKPFVCFKYDE